MRFLYLNITALALAGLALTVTGCSSNNTGKIIGKWKISAPPEKDPKTKEEFEAMGKMGLFVFIEFKADNALLLGLGSDKPETLDMLKALAPKGKEPKTSWEAKYKLLPGDKVEVYDMKDDETKKMFKGDKARSDIIITGDEMTIKDPDGSMTKLTRMK